MNEHAERQKELCVKLEGEGGASEALPGCCEETLGSREKQGSSFRSMCLANSLGNSSTQHCKTRHFGYFKLLSCGVSLWLSWNLSPDMYTLGLACLLFLFLSAIIDVKLSKGRGMKIFVHFPPVSTQSPVWHSVNSCRKTAEVNISVFH